MAEPGSVVHFLADRLAVRDDVESLRGLIRRLQALGHSCRVICRSAAPDHGLADLVEVPGLGRRWQRPWAVRGLELVDGPDRDRPQLLHVLHAGMADAGLEIADRWRMPYLLGVDEFPRPDSRLRVGRSWCRGLVATNRELGDALRRDFHVPGSMLHVVPAGVPELDDRPRPRRLVAGSGFSTFLVAARKVVDSGVDAEFLIAGQGEDEAELRRRADRLRIADRLTFAHEIPHGLTFWDVLDVYCQTSMVPTVGRPLALAMAAGVPAIATDVEGTRTLVLEGATGRLVPRGDASALASAIVEALAEPDRSRALGEAGRRTILLDRHPDREAERLDALYRAIVREGLGPRDRAPTGRATGVELTGELDATGLAASVLPWARLEA
jgi:glycosyltransferase involved in cell wall biosynthesis